MAKPKKQLEDTDGADPVVETPSVEASAVEAPKVETPLVEASKDTKPKTKIAVKKKLIIT